MFWCIKKSSFRDRFFIHMQKKLKTIIAFVHAAATFSPELSVIKLPVRIAFSCSRIAAALAKLPDVVGKRKHVISLQHLALYFFKIFGRNGLPETLVLPQGIENRKADIAVLVLKYFLTHTQVPHFKTDIIYARHPAGIELVIKIGLENKTFVEYPV